MPHRDGFYRGWPRADGLDQGLHSGRGPGSARSPTGRLRRPLRTNVRTTTLFTGARTAELLLRWSLSKRLSGWPSHAELAAREARFVAALQGGARANRRERGFDRPRAERGSRLRSRRQWRAGARFVFYTGTPTPAMAGNVPVPPYHDQRDPPVFPVGRPTREALASLGMNGSIAFVVEG